MESYRRPVYILNHSPSTGLSGALHYDATIDLFEGEATIKRVGFPSEGIAIEDSRGRVVFLDGSSYPAKIEDWTRETMKAMSSTGTLGYPVEELEAIKEAFCMYLDNVRAGHIPVRSSDA
jgi:hypothetical protein